MDFSPSDLRRVGIFRKATDEDLAELASTAILRAAEEGEYFFLQGDPAGFAHVLTMGHVKLLQTNRLGQAVNLRTIYPWQVFGALGAVRAEAEYPASAQALANSQSLAIPSMSLRRLLESRPYLSIDLMGLMTTYIQDMQARYRELATEKVEQRIGRTLLRLAAQSGQEASGGIELALTRQDLAEMTGSTLHTVSRVLAEWDRQGIIDSRREHLKITNPHGLVRIADGLP
jgi:CRP/FNR family transcriptional regulator, nitrogen oxide reductase regulator